MGSYTEKLKLFKYDPSTDGNVPFSIQQALNDNWDKIDAAGGGSGSGLEIGDIGIALYVDETKGLRRRLNGSILSINTNTQGFVTFLKGLQATSPSLFVTETNWQAEVNLSKFGQCGKFVLNETAGTIRLPKVVNINGLQDLNQAGIRLDEKLPNIKTTGSNFSAITHGTSTNPTTIDYSPFKADTSQKAGANGSTYYAAGMSFNASRSSSTYQDDAPVQQEAIQYPYFIQIATGETTEVDIINEIELNNPYSLFDCKYTDHKLNNLSWLLSQGQWNSGSVYVDAFQLLLRIFNGTETIEGISVKDTNGSYTDYDFVIDTVSGTFRLPLKSKIAGGKAVVGNGMTLGFTDGANNYGFEIGLTNAYLYSHQSSYGKPTGSSPGSGNNPTNLTAGITTDSSKSGIELSDDGVYLYYYVGETVQNVNLIDAGRIGEQLANKADKSEVDGQWVQKRLTPFNDLVRIGTYTFDLSEYLPNDNYQYELMCNLFVNNDTQTSGTNSWVSMWAGNGSSESSIGVISTVTDKSAGLAYNSGILVIQPNDRIITLDISGVALTSHAIGYILAYRRVGTNQ